jgi:hypothetical protein
MNDITRFNKLTSEVDGEYIIDSLKKTKEEIFFLCDFHTTVTAGTAFFVGKRLAAMKAHPEHGAHGKFLKYLEKEFPYSHKTANNYMRLYEAYKDNPEAMHDIGLRQALINAGIIKDKPKKIIPLLPSEEKSEYNDYSSAVIAEAFKKPPLNKNVTHLKKHRFGINGNEITLFKKGHNQLITAASLNLPGTSDPRLNKKYKALLIDVQKNLEEYFQQYEYALLEDKQVLKEHNIT